jgi:hypothetical protein
MFIALLSLQLLPQRLQRPPYACLNRTQWGTQAGSDFLMTESLKECQEEGISLLSGQRRQSVTHGLALGSICQGQGGWQRLEHLLRKRRFVCEAPAVTP